MIVHLLKEESSQRLIFAVPEHVKKNFLFRKISLDKLWAIRKSMSDSPDFAEKFLRKLKQTKSNEEFFAQLSDEMKKGINES